MFGIQNAIFRLTQQKTGTTPIFCIYTENLNLLYRITGFLSIKNIFVIRFCKTAFCGYIQLSADKDAYRQKEGHSEMTYSRERKTEKYLYPSAKKI